MTDLVSTLQIVLQDAGYRTWLTSVDRLTAVGFEDDAVMGFACTFEGPEMILGKWRLAEATLLNRYAPSLQRARDKSWNVYSVFCSTAPADELQTRAIRQIEEDLERTRKLTGCGLTGHAEVSLALLPLLPIQYRPRLERENVTERLAARLQKITSVAPEVVLDEHVTPAEVVRLLTASQ